MNEEGTFNVDGGRTGETRSDGECSQRGRLTRVLGVRVFHKNFGNITNL